jgi:L-lactate dehydrogenase complex protein LldG
MSRDDRQSISARDSILRAVNLATAKPRKDQLVARDAGWAALPRRYRRSSDRNSEQILALLIERLIDYDAHIKRVSDSGVSSALGQLLLDLNSKQLLIPSGFPERWRPANIEVVETDSLDAAALDSFNVVMTTATWGIAETGTLVLAHGHGQGRRALSLLADHHICVLRAADVVSTVSEAFVRLAPASSQPITFISGPSATADIEMTRIKGVHGPRFLYVVLVD